MVDNNSGLDGLEVTRYEAERRQEWSSAQADFQKRNDRVAHYRRLYAGEHYYGDRAVQSELNMPRNVLNTYVNTIDLAVGMLISNELDYQVISQAGDREAKRLASMQEQFFDGITYVNADDQEQNLRYWWTFRQVLDGGVGIKTYWDPIRHRTLEQVGQTEKGDPIWAFRKLPLRMEVLPIDQLYPQPGGQASPWRHLFYAEEKTIWEVERQHQIQIAEFAALLEQDKRTRTCTYLDYWREVEEVSQVEVCPDCLNATPPGRRVTQVLWVTLINPCEKCGSQAPPRNETQPHYAWENAILYNGKLIVVPRKMPGYDFYPYSVLACKPVDQKKREDWSHGLLEPIDEPVYGKERLLNYLDRQLLLDLARGVVTYTMDGRGVPVDQAFGKATHLKVGEDVGYPNALGTPEELKYKLAHLDNQIQEGSFPISMYGGGPSQVSGYAMSLMGDAGRIRLTQIVTSQEQGLTTVARKCAALTAYFARDAAIQIYGQRSRRMFQASITGDDMKGQRINVRLTPQYPNEEQRRVALATQLRGDLSEETRWEKYLSIQQPDQEKERKLAEMAENHPAMVHYQVMSLMAKWAAQNDQIAATTLAKMQQESLPTDKPGPDKAPPNAEQVPGQPTSTLGAVTPQEMGGRPPGQGGMEG